MDCISYLLTSLMQIQYASLQLQEIALVEMQMVRKLYQIIILMIFFIYYRYKASIISEVRFYS